MSKLVTTYVLGACGDVLLVSAGLITLWPPDAPHHRRGSWHCGSTVGMATGEPADGRGGWHR